MAAEGSRKKKYVPGCDDDGEDIFDFPFTKDEITMEFLKEHGRIMFIVRGPPGTGKSTLSQMLCVRYPDGIVCCADNFFKNSFTSPTRNRDSLAKSHQYCHKKVHEACSKGNNMIIVQNTHMRKQEMQHYINYAAEFNYTVLMAITTRKFEINPEILEKTNTQGLTKDYFRNRLRQWEEVSPIATGWFICPEDTSYLFNQLQVSLEALLDDGKFCRVFDAYEKKDLLKCFKARRQLYCKAAYGNSVNDYAMKSYYLSDEVQDSYGKAFDIALDGFVIDREFIAAVVQVENTTKNLTLPSSKATVKRELDFEERFARQLSVNENLRYHNETCELNKEFSDDSKKTIQLLDREQEKAVNVNDCHFIYFAHKEFAHLDANEVDQLCSSLLSPFADEAGNIEGSKYIELNEDVRILRLSDEAWYICAPKKIKFQSIFTGLYI